MKTIISIAIAGAFMAPTAASAQSATDVVVMRRAIAPPRAATKPPLPATKATCSLGAPAVVYSATSVISYDQKTVSGWSGTLSEVTAATKAFCEAYQGATACEGFVEYNGTLKITAYKATGVQIRSGDAEYGRRMGVAGTCIPT